MLFVILNLSNRSAFYPQSFKCTQVCGWRVCGTHARHSMSKEDFDERVKVILLGDSAVGKTCLLLRYAEKSFKRTWVTTIGIDYKFR